MTSLARPHVTWYVTELYCTAVDMQVPPAEDRQKTASTPFTKKLASSTWLFSVSVRLSILWRTPSNVVRIFADGSSRAACQDERILISETGRGIGLGWNYIRTGF